MIGISGRHWACWNRLDLLYMIRGLKYVECAQKLNKNSLFLMKIQSKYAVFAVLKAVLRAYGVFSCLILVDLDSKMLISAQK